ncbi:MAG: hypothetical protein PPHEINF_6064 [uncultured Paraburkholderia sp.]|nr:MAG: hypothetical protein PPHEINF_6064 [uncultured Paraburkholderia sp.]CAH2936291.1 MAG: hypothetical protein PPHERAN_4489 [uncultured Paraburkholderia sp.]CAH2944231.1 MAG: hypothetical protein PPHEMADMSA_6104 [uncultured Paraburkholderia sp.]
MRARRPAIGEFSGNAASGTLRPRQRNDNSRMAAQTFKNDRSIIGEAPLPRSPDRLERLEGVFRFYACVG